MNKKKTLIIVAIVCVLILSFVPTFLSVQKKEKVQLDNIGEIKDSADELKISGKEELETLELTEMDSEKMHSLLSPVIQYPFTGELNIKSLKSYMSRNDYDKLHEVLSNFDTSTTKGDLNYNYNKITLSGSTDGSNSTYTLTAMYLPTEEDLINGNFVYKDGSMLSLTFSIIDNKISFMDYGYFTNKPDADASLGINLVAGVERDLQLTEEVLMQFVK